MVIHRVFDEVFRTWSHVAVLRTLLDTTTGYTGNEVGRLAGMHPRSALKALSALETLGIVRRLRGGRDHIFTLNREHYIVRECLEGMFRVEQSMPGAIVSALSKSLRNKTASTVIFGSVARNEEGPESDFDILCVVRAESEKERARTALQLESHNLQRVFGVKLAPIFFTVHEFRKRAKSPFVKNAARDGILVTGRPLRSVLDGKTLQEKVR